MKIIDNVRFGKTVSRKGTMQVLVLVGEGSNQRSVTRHAVRQGADWVGNNPDERVTKMHSDAEANLAHAEETLTRTQKLHEKLKKEENVTEDELFIVRTALNVANNRRAGAKERLARVQEDFPLRVIFRQ